MTMKWVKKWRLNRTTLNPEQVRITEVGNDWVLCEGEQHTCWRGNFFDSPEAAFAHEREDAEGSIRYGNERLERVARAEARFREAST